MVRSPLLVFFDSAPQHRDSMQLECHMPAGDAIGGKCSTKCLTGTRIDLRNGFALSKGRRARHDRALLAASATPSGVRSMNRRSLLYLLSLFLALPASVRAADPPRRPNLVFIFADDLAW